MIKIKYRLSVPEKYLITKSSLDGRNENYMYSLFPDFRNSERYNIATIGDNSDYMLFINYTNANIFKFPSNYRLKFQLENSNENGLIVGKISMRTVPLLTALTIVSFSSITIIKELSSDYHTVSKPLLEILSSLIILLLIEFFFFKSQCDYFFRQVL